jgi:hypothetical protein
MGACEFSNLSFGKNANEAYRTAVINAECENGYDGYNGTISTTSGFVEMALPSKMVAPKVFVELVFGAMDEDWKVPSQYRKFERWVRRAARVIEKRGECVCFELTGDRAAKLKAKNGLKGTRAKAYVFVGLAAC